MPEIKWYNSENELMVARKFASPLQGPLAKKLRVENRQNDKREILPPTVIHNQGPSQQAREEDIRLTQKELAGPETKHNRKTLPHLHTKNNSCFQPRWT